MKQADLRNLSKKTSKSVCTSILMVSADLLYPTPSTSSAMKTPDDAEEDPDAPEQADGFIVQPKYGSSNKKLHLSSYCRLPS